MLQISPSHCNPRWKSESPYKGGNPRSWPSTHTHEFAATKAMFLPPPWIPSPWGRAPKKPWRKGAKGRRTPIDVGGAGGVPCATAGAGAALRSSPPSPPPIPPCIQWFILPQTSVPLYVNMVFDAIIFILWFTSCFRSLFVFWLLCWMHEVH